MNKILTLIMLFVSLSAQIFAQGDYKPGYLINLQNDTLKGFVDYKEWEFNPRSINFKRSLSQKKSEKITCDNTNAFAVTNLEYYQKAIVNVSKASIEMEHLATGIDTSYKTDTVFLKVLINGKNVSLYSFTDDNKTRFYISDKLHKAPVELNYYVYVSQYSSSSLQTAFQYREQLDGIATKYKAGDNQLLQKIKVSKYTESDLQKIVGRLNGDKNNQTEHKDLFGVRIFAGLGLKINKLSFDAGNSQDMAGPFPYGAKATSTYPLLAGGIDFFLNKNTKTLFFRAEINFTQNHFYIPNTDVNVLNAQGMLDIKQFETSFIPQIVFNFYSKDKFKIFIDVGASINICFNNDYYYYVNYNNVSSIKNYNYPEFKHVWLSVPVKLGFVISNKVEVYAVYSNSASQNNVDARPPLIGSYQAGINYLF